MGIYEEHVLCYSVPLGGGVISTYQILKPCDAIRGTDSCHYCCDKINSTHSNNNEQRVLSVRF